MLPVSNKIYKELNIEASFKQCPKHGVTVSANGVICSSNKRKQLGIQYEIVIPLP